MLHAKLSNRSVFLLLMFASLYSQAQLGTLWQKAKEKTEKAVNKVMPKKNSTQAVEAEASAPFIPGNMPLFSEDFSGYTAGATVSTIKSNGLAAVTGLKGHSGKWMPIEDKAVYKLTKAIPYPEHFTVTFDLLATGDQIKDIAPLSFGFASDNSTKEYTSNSGAYVELQYYDANMVNTGSKNPEKFANNTFDLEPYLNTVMHINLEVNGQRMIVYLGNRKIADGIFFAPSAGKNFYISAPWQYSNGAKVFLSNIKIAGFNQ
ncbi:MULTISPECIES: hypothetical protein [Chryseobacterium]|uniref:Alginate lyase 2 domain-containing protein n=1 Tax=Chryseobacterium camelliae TaxID=1265445 RepID=A0ABU0TI74_9FLAO|nr:MULTISPECIES: hypothetical protein [Chryseobacterium]MDT3409375.1 hypothetical protein [Pseudacidovorax intermedius]MDQ1096760.1 hypothetical protein [Chryseobacterium camelliae]MDQ1100703.1 hypothetical protein [Chryseobacterium sp. SORGH_AS_1048]MDR6088042.1 hypothetical protein [Chryseobacterium sp. SORGH_AS_0909]MDR6132416.1 hypothetical protein [Chryseobacterium sp. SORGH_AS_1175]